MAKSKYRPNYAVLYPNTEISPAIMEVLHQSDLKMEYMEQDLKRERLMKKNGGAEVTYRPAREDSYDRLLEVNRQFGVLAPAPDAVLFHKADIEALRECLNLLDHKDRALVNALFFKKMTERQYGEIIGVSHQAINKQKAKVIAKLKKLMDF